MAPKGEGIGACASSEICESKGDLNLNPVPSADPQPSSPDGVLVAISPEDIAGPAGLEGKGRACLYIAGPAGLDIDIDIAGPDIAGLEDIAGPAGLEDLRCVVCGIYGLLGLKTCRQGRGFGSG